MAPFSFSPLLFTFSRLLACFVVFELWLVKAEEAGRANLAGKSCLLVSLKRLELIYFAEIAEPA